MRVQSPTTGAMTGSAGNIIYQHYFGHTYGRSHPVFYHDRKSKAQLDIRGRFYPIRDQIRSIYAAMQGNIPNYCNQQINVFNHLLSSCLSALRTYQNDSTSYVPRSIKMGKYKYIAIPNLSHLMVRSGKLIRVEFTDITYQTHVDFAPYLAYLLFLNPVEQTIMDAKTDFSSSFMVFQFEEETEPIPLDQYVVYLALVDDQYFSDFFLSTCR